MLDYLLWSDELLREMNGVGWTDTRKSFKDVSAFFKLFKKKFSSSALVTFLREEGENCICVGKSAHIVIPSESLVLA